MLGLILQFTCFNLRVQSYLETDGLHVVNGQDDEHSVLSQAIYVLSLFFISFLR